MSEYDFEAFFERSAEMLCIAGADGCFRRVNPAFQRILGWTAEELTGRSFSDFIHPNDIEPTAKEVGQAMGDVADQHAEIGLIYLLAGRYFQN